MRSGYRKVRTTLIIFGLVLGVNACKSKIDKTKVAEDVPIIYKTDTTDAAGNKKGIKPPIINITDTVSERSIVLVVKDSAATSERIGFKMANIYKNILPSIINQQKLQVTGARMAWYKTSSPPFFFEAGLPVNKKPLKLAKNVYIKNIGIDSAVVAHFYGPYELTFQAYEALKDWMKSNKKHAAGAPYEIYVGDMYDNKGKVNDPYRVRTDIVFPHN